jgi:uncharacterized protein (TIGR02145 family)
MRLRSPSFVLSGLILALCSPYEATGQSAVSLTDVVCTVTTPDWCQLDVTLSGVLSADSEAYVGFYDGCIGYSGSPAPISPGDFEVSLSLDCTEWPHWVSTESQGSYTTPGYLCLEEMALSVCADSTNWWDENQNGNEYWNAYIAIFDDGPCQWTVSFSENGSSQLILDACGPGTVWNPEVGECVIAVPADTDFDGCVTAGDVLNLLAAFGTCPPVPEWPDVEDEAPSASIDCADSVLCHGHYYQTVVIGEQCWFAENLRTTQYNEPDPDTPLQVVQPSEWASVNGEGLWDGVACVNPMALDTSLGLLYNHHAVFGNGNVCPTDWRVPTTIDWAVLEMELGGSADEVGGVIGWRAYGVGEALKASSEGSCCSEFGWDGNGTSGFDAVPSGSIHPTGEFANTTMAFFWTSDTWSSSHGWRRKLGGGVSAIMNEWFFMDGGMSVRCVKY